MKLIVCALLILSTAGVHAQGLRCEILKKYVCEPGGCKSVPAKIWNRVDLSNHSYARCDSAGCDNYAVEISQSGAFLNLAIPKNGVVAKITIGNNSFHEVVSLGQIVYVSFGVCKLTN
jgi:hypothetical protein